MNFDNRECERFGVDTFTAETAKHAEFILLFSLRSRRAQRLIG